MKIARLDHLVLTVADVARSVEFYTRVLGLEEVTFGHGRKALVFGNQKINLHERGHEIDPKAMHPTTGSADLCFVAETPVGQVITELQNHGVEIIDGPVPRTGATGSFTSVYFAIWTATY